MRYDKCLTCKNLGTKCDGPNLLLMDAKELGKWCDEMRKKRPGATYDKTASETNISKTAVYNFLTGAHTDCRLETARQIAGWLIGDTCDGNHCGNVTSSEKAAYEERIKQLENEIKWRDDTIKTFTEESKRMHDEKADTLKNHQHSQDFIRAEIKRKNKFISILSILLGISLAVIITFLVVDRINNDIGFFWLRGILNGSGIVFSNFG